MDGFHDATRLATLHNSAMPGPLTPSHKGTVYGDDDTPPSSLYPLAHKLITNIFLRGTRSTSSRAPVRESDGTQTKAEWTRSARALGRSCGGIVRVGAL